MKKMYLGYDLGDGETIINIVFHESEENEINMNLQDLTMPGVKDIGKAVPTIYAKKCNNNEIVFASYIEEDGESVINVHSNFKRRPTDLVSIEDDEILDVFDIKTRLWPSDTRINSGEMQYFKESVVEFTNAIFTDNLFVEQLRSEVEKHGGVDEIVICVGHPTKWSKQDCVIYQKILQQSVLGEQYYIDKPLKLLVAGESRAAFLYVRDSSDNKSIYQNIVVLIDVGSSTVDLTAVRGDAKNNAYNSGHNYLGARIVDYLILDWYLDQLRNGGEYDDYKKIIEAKPNMEKVLLLQCRMAKEKIFGTSAESARIPFCDFRSVRISETDLNTLLTIPIKSVMKHHLSMSEEILEKIGDNSWKDEFETFLKTQREILDKNDFKVESIILTGSASKMPIIKEVAAKVFNLPVFFDSEPSKTISKGLALVGYSNDKSEKFQEDAERIINEQIPLIVEEDIPEFANSLAKNITNYVCDNVVLPNLYSWKDGTYKTISNAMSAIKEDCSEENLTSYIQQNEQCKEMISTWLRDKVGKDIALKLHALCQKYNVDDVSVDQLNFLDIRTDGIIGSGFDDSIADTILQPADIIINIVTIITGILAAVVTPSILGVVVGIVIVITNTVGLLIFDLLLAIPGFGWAILLGLAGIGAAKATKGQLSSMKDKLSKKLVTADLPAIARKAISKEKLNKSVNEERCRISKKIEDAILEDSSKDKICSKISATLEKQVDEILENMRYIIESK